MNKLMWDDRDGLYYDYNFVRQTACGSYPFLTTFYPLWAGIASKEQAAAGGAEPAPNSSARAASRPAPMQAATSGTRPSAGRRCR